MIFVFSYSLSMPISRSIHAAAHGIISFFVYGCVLVAQSCMTLCDPVDCSPPGFSVHWILQARMLEWVAISFPRGSSQPRDKTRAFLIAGRLFTMWATREAFYGWVIFNCIYVESITISSNAFPAFIEIIVWFFFFSFKGTSNVMQWLKKKKIHLAMQESQEVWSNPWVRKIPWRWKCQSTPVFLPGKSLGQRSLAGYSLWGHKRIKHS